LRAVIVSRSARRSVGDTRIQAFEGGRMKRCISPVLDLVRRARRGYPATVRSIALLAAACLHAFAQAGWPQLGFNNPHLAANPFETILSVSTVPGLRPAWTFPTKGIVTSAAVVGGVAYFASGDGRAYAVNAATGALLWKTELPGGGTSSSPAVIGGKVYLGTG